MQMKTAARLRKNWGDKVCDHPDFDREYCLGGQTGDYVCVQCGESFTQSAVNEIEVRRTCSSDK